MFLKIRSSLLPGFYRQWGATGGSELKVILSDVLKKDDFRSYLVVKLRSNYEKRKLVKSEQVRKLL